MEPMLAAGIPDGTVIHAVCEKGAVWFSYTAAGPGPVHVDRELAVGRRERHRAGAAGDRAGDHEAAGPPGGWAFDPGALDPALDKALGRLLRLAGNVAAAAPGVTVSGHLRVEVAQVASGATTSYGIAITVDPGQRVPLTSGDLVLAVEVDSSWTDVLPGASPGLSVMLLDHDGGGYHLAAAPSVRGNEKPKVLPTPSWDFSHSRPSKSSTMRRDRVRPRPVPSSRATPRPPCWKDSKIRSRSSSGMPTPVSVTVTTSSWSTWTTRRGAGCT